MTAAAVMRGICLISGVGEDATYVARMIASDRYRFAA